MSFIDRMLNQKAVWWKRLTSDEYGKFSYDTPLEIDCRWDDESREFRDIMGELKVSRATVYVDREISVGDILKKGEQESDTPDDPQDTTDAFQVQSIDTNPDVKAVRSLYSAYVT